MIDTISTADDRLRLVLVLAENNLEVVETEIRADDGTPYRLRARALETGTGDVDGTQQAVVHVAESVASDGEHYLDIGQYERAVIDDLAVMHRQQIRELHVRQNQPQSDLQRRQNARTRQQVRNRKALQDAFDDARLESWSRSNQVIGDA